MRLWSLATLTLFVLKTISSEGKIFHEFFNLFNLFQFFNLTPSFGVLGSPLLKPKKHVGSSQWLQKLMDLNHKTYFLINEKTLLNILDTFLCKIMKRELKCIFKLCAAILQDLEHPKNRPPISLSHTIECVWERRTSMFLVLDTNLW